MRKVILGFLSIIVIVISQSGYALETSIIKDIRIQGLHVISKEELLSLLELKPGDFLNTKQLSIAIKRIFRKGLFKDIIVEYKEGTLVLKVQERKILYSVEMKGVSGDLERELSSAIPFRYGAIYRKEMKESVLRVLKNRLFQLGYPEAKIKVLIVDKGESFVKIICYIDKGPPSVVRDIRIKISPPVKEIEPIDLKLMMTTGVGSVLDREVLRSDIEKIKNYFKKKGYFLVHIYEPTIRDGVLELKIYAGVKYIVEFLGNRVFSDEQLRLEAGFDTLRTYSHQELEAVAYRIKRLYKRKGYLMCAVVTTITYTPVKIKIAYKIQEGPLFKVRKTIIKGGNVPSKVLLKRLYLKKNEPFNPEMLKRDTSTIKSVYRSIGYRNVNVNWDIRIVPDKHQIDLTYIVNPGKVFTIYSVRFKGNRFFPTERIQDVFGIKPGSLFNEVDLEEARRKVQRLYHSKGFLDVTVNINTVFEDNRVLVTVQIEEGQRYKIGKIIIKGNINTDYSVFLRKMPFREGEYLNPELLPEFVRGLYSTGLFSNVSVKPIDATERIKDLIVEVEEAPAGMVELSIGFGEYEKLRGAFEIRYLNLFGKNRTGSLRLEINTLRTSAQVRYRDPYFWKPDIELLSRVKFEKEKVKNFDTGQINYRAKKYSAGIGLQKAFTRNLTGSISYEYSIVRTYDINPDVVLSEKDKGYLGIESLIYALTYDRRDNPFNPSEGFVAGITLKNASSYLLGQTDFIKTTGSIAAYFRLLSPLVVALGARGGVAYGYRDTDELPIVERFFLGGRNSVRGFAQDSLGPKGPDGNPTGGNAFLQENVELRLRVIGNLGIVGFLDGGNVWRTADEISTHLRYAAGVGLRLNTPAGPIRLDYGWKLKVEPGESPGEFHFSIGHAF